MRFHRGIAVVAVLIIVGGAAAANDREHVDPSGFSFTYPDGWVLLVKPGNGFQEFNLPKGIQTWIKNKTISISAK